MTTHTWHQRIDDLLAKSTIPATLLVVMGLFFFTDDPIHTVLSWGMLALFAGAVAGLATVIIRAILR